MTSPPTYRRVCIVAGEDYTVFGPDGTVVGFIKKTRVDGWCRRLWSHDQVCIGETLDEAFHEIVREHGELQEREGTG